MMKSQITVVIPVYNREGIVRRTLDSVASQEVKPAKVVLVDNSSTDGTPEVLEQWRREHPELDVCVLREERPGASAARNRGLKEVDSEFVMFFDSDDVMLPGHIGDFQRAIERRPKMDIWGRSVWVKKLDGCNHKLYFTSRSPMVNHLFRGCLSTQRFVVRTSLVRDCGGWNEHLRGWNDYELGVRLLLATDKVGELHGEPTVQVFRIEDSITGTARTLHSERWEESLGAIEGYFRERGMRRMVRLTDARRMILAAQYSRESERASDPQLRREGEENARRLRAEVLLHTDSPRRMKLIYKHNRKFKRLTWVLARFLYPW